MLFTTQKTVLQNLTCLSVAVFGSKIKDFTTLQEQDFTNSSFKVSLSHDFQAELDLSKMFSQHNVHHHTDNMKGQYGDFNPYWIEDYKKEGIIPEISPEDRE